jgi:phosphoribosylformylglycinamidine (FGAM) synthase PurS component
MKVISLIALAEDRMLPWLSFSLGLEMNLDELAEEINNIPSEKVVHDLYRILIEWKNSEESAEELKEGIERYLGNTWIESKADHEKIYRMWLSFRDEVIANIGGMTMNERLYWFGLFERFEAYSSQEDKMRIYRKLHARP